MNLKSRFLELIGKLKEKILNFIIFIVDKIMYIVYVIHCIIYAGLVKLDLYLERVKTVLIYRLKTYPIVFFLSIAWMVHCKYSLYGSIVWLQWKYLPQYDLMKALEQYPFMWSVLIAYTCWCVITIIFPKFFLENKSTLLMVMANMFFSYIWMEKWWAMEREFYFWGDIVYQPWYIWMFTYTIGALTNIFEEFEEELEEDFDDAELLTHPMAFIRGTTVHEDTWFADTSDFFKDYKAIEKLEERAQITEFHQLFMDAFGNVRDLAGETPEYIQERYWAFIEKTYPEELDFIKQSRFDRHYTQVIDQIRIWDTYSMAKLVYLHHKDNYDRDETEWGELLWWKIRDWLIYWNVKYHLRGIFFGLYYMWWLPWKRPRAAGPYEYHFYIKREFPFVIPKWINKIHQKYNFGFAVFLRLLCFLWWVFSSILWLFVRRNLRSINPYFWYRWWRYYRYEIRWRVSLIKQRKRRSGNYDYFTKVIIG